MAQITLHRVHAFTDHNEGGNPATVVLDADHLSEEDKQKIAHKSGTYRTAFVSSSSSATVKTEFFTPQAQIAHSSHATLAVFSLLRKQGKWQSSEATKETIDGIRKIYFEDGQVFIEQKAPVFHAPLDIWQAYDEQALLAGLNLSARDLLAPLQPVIGDMGNPFLLIPLKNAAVLKKARVVDETVKHYSEFLDVVGCYLFSLDVKQQGHDASTRLFAPRLGIKEESATGVAAGILAGFLYEFINMKKLQFVIEQGHYLQPPSPSLLHIKLNTVQQEIAHEYVGGCAQHDTTEIISY
ncbi:PhzF family phenazine biosynthesis protein [Zooshikella harenae]|uniref:PhzF family phenazine biosynthesis protein n=1 Tax=Zooshikella harenae TaxID=2827238 RepID=A0ABS5ZFR5_9GAMM|nr:PhzF family phenazine biosynthesis protein [Zooshikella harenae]MBU2712909.1 PhzF family phenazine biosynthesis protein [Zooshikella harenae]